MVHFTLFILCVSFTFSTSKCLCTLFSFTAQANLVHHSKDKKMCPAVLLSVSIYLLSEIINDSLSC